RRRRRAAAQRPHRRQRAVAAAAQPRRGLLHAHQRPRGGARMTAIASTAAIPTVRKRRFATLRHSLVLARRSLINTLRTPESLIDVTLQPAIFLALFTYVFGGAIAHGSQHDYLQFLLPGVLGQTIAMGGMAIGVNLNNDISKGVFDRFRSLPIARS